MTMNVGGLAKIGYQKRYLRKDADRDIEQLTGHGHLYVNQCEARYDHNIDGDRSSGVPELIDRD
jgi:hypothetical protein